MTSLLAPMSTLWINSYAWFITRRRSCPTCQRWSYTLLPAEAFQWLVDNDRTSSTAADMTKQITVMVTTVEWLSTNLHTEVEICLCWIIPCRTTFVQAAMNSTGLHFAASSITYPSFVGGVSLKTLYLPFCFLASAFLMNSFLTQLAWTFMTFFLTSMQFTRKQLTTWQIAHWYLISTARSYQIWCNFIKI